MKKKQYRLREEEIQPLIESVGGCIASDAITVDGLPVGFCYREEPDFEEDSGWRFFAGTEADSYLSNADNLGIFEVNTIANCDPAIIPLLDEPVGVAFERDHETNTFQGIDLEDE